MTAGAELFQMGNERTDAKLIIECEGSSQGLTEIRGRLHRIAKTIVLLRIPATERLTLRSPCSDES